MFDPQNAREKLHDYITGWMEEYGGETRVAVDDSLVESGRLDSLAILYLIVFMEQEFGVNFNHFEFDPERFDTIHYMVQVLEELTARGGGQENHSS